MTSQKYLVPLDGSDLGEHALPWARLLSSKTSIPVELLRCHESLSSIYMPAEFAAPVAYDENALNKQIVEYLDELTLTFPDGLATRSSIEGDPATVVLEKCESEHIEAVIMASHGRGGLGRWLLGSVATKIVRGSQVPVLVINASADVPEKPHPKKILVPLDGSKVAEAALTQALKLAAALDAELILYQGITHTPIGHPDLDAAVNLEVQNAKDYLDSVKKRFPDTRISTLARITGLNLGILAQSEHCDLVIMSSHGRSGVKRWLLGSVAEKILQAINKPLMIVYGQTDST